MARDDLSTKLRELHEASERVSANLVALEVDSDRRLLASTALSGESAVEWTDANEALTELWRRQGLLEGLLAQAEKLRGSRHADELRALLYGQSVELGGSEVSLADRRLLEAGTRVERVSPSDLLAGMAVLFDRATSVIARIGEAWAKQVPGLDRARELLRELNALVSEVGGSAQRDVVAVSRRLEELTSKVTADPLSVPAEAIDRLITDMTALRDELAGSAALQREFATRRQEARELLQQVQHAESERAVAEEELRIKILTQLPPPTPQDDLDLEERLSEIDDLAEGGRWRDARRALEEWTAQADSALREARRARDCSRGPIEARNRFRGLLDAYQVKAKRLGRLEDPQVAALYTQAHEALYTAPTDLEQAAERVRSYQRALSGATPETETVT